MPGSRNPEYRSDALEVLHKTMSDLQRHAVVDTATMQRFDLGCLTPPEGQDVAGKDASNPNRPS